MVTLQLPEPVQAPVHSLNSDPAAGVSFSSTSAPSSNSASQPAPEPQLIAAGVLVTVPLPVPVFETVSLNSSDVASATGAKANRWEILTVEPEVA
jgi:hypothetical protein